MITPNEGPKALYHVLIGIPTGESVKMGFAFDLAHLVGTTVAHTPDIVVSPLMLQGSILPSTRQNIVLEALGSEATHILWIDSDMRFPADTLLRLLEHDKDIVACNATTRKMPIVPVTKKKVDGVIELVYTKPESHGLEAVDFIGFGCVLTKVDVFRRLPLPHFHLLYRKETAEFGGEDSFFSYHAKANGFELLIDHDLSKEIGHIGDFTYQHEHAYALIERKIVSAV